MAIRARAGRPSQFDTALYQRARCITNRGDHRPLQYEGDSKERAYSRLNSPLARFPGVRRRHIPTSRLTGAPSACMASFDRLTRRTKWPVRPRPHAKKSWRFRRLVSGGATVSRARKQFDPRGWLHQSVQRCVPETGIRIRRGPRDPVEGR